MSRVWCDGMTVDPCPAHGFHCPRHNQHPSTQHGVNCRCRKCEAKALRRQDGKAMLNALVNPKDVGARGGWGKGRRKTQ